MCGLPHGLSAEPVDKTNDNDVCIFRVQFSVCLSELEDPESYIFNGFVAIGEYIIVLLSPYLLVCFCLLLFFTSLESQCLMINTGLFKVFCLCSLPYFQFPQGLRNPALNTLPFFKSTQWSAPLRYNPPPHQESIEK